MGNRILGTILFPCPALGLFRIAGCLASERCEGWGWFLFAGLILSAIALNLWTGQMPDVPCPSCGKPRPSDDLS